MNCSKCNLCLTASINLTRTARWRVTDWRSVVTESCGRLYVFIMGHATESVTLQSHFQSGDSSLYSERWRIAQVPCDMCESTVYHCSRPSLAFDDGRLYSSTAAGGY